jgi:hypothetical protein
MTKGSELNEPEFNLPITIVSAIHKVDSQTVCRTFKAGEYAETPKRPPKRVTRTAPDVGLFKSDEFIRRGGR